MSRTEFHHWTVYHTHVIDKDPYKAVTEKGQGSPFFFLIGFPCTHRSIKSSRERSLTLGRVRRKVKRAPYNHTS